MHNNKNYVKTPRFWELSDHAPWKEEAAAAADAAAMGSGTKPGKNMGFIIIGAKNAFKFASISKNQSLLAINLSDLSVL